MVQDADICPALTFGNPSVQQLHGRPAVPAQPALGAANVLEAATHCQAVCQLLAAGFDGMVMVTKAEAGDAIIRKHKIVSAAAGTSGLSAQDHAKLDRIEEAQRQIKVMLENQERRNEDRERRNEDRERRIEIMFDNQRACIANSGSRMLGHPLVKLKTEQHPQTPGGPQLGSEPGENVPFPATKEGISILTNEQLDDLETFYGRKFAGQSIAARRHAFHLFVGM